MARNDDGRGRASYGVDAPGFLVFAAVFFSVSVTTAVVSRRPGPILGAAVLLMCVGFFLHTSRRGKFLVWDELLGGLHLKGSERILDLGCGRGAVLLSAAKRLSTGHAFGVDIWSRIDQSGNAPNAVRRNVELEGLQTHVALATADMTALPFRGGAFDVVVSSIAIHNIKERSRRQDAIDEAVRVLRPGGRLLIADLRGTRDYATRLTSLGMVDVARRSLGWRMWWGGPWGQTRLVTATRCNREHG